MKVTFGSAHDILYFYLVEVFPTPVRAAGYSYSCAVDELGAFIIPFMVESMDEIYIFIIFFIFGLVDTVIMIWIYPETYGNP